MRKSEFRSVWLLLLLFCAAAAVVLALCRTTQAGMPDTVGRKLTAEEQAEITARNSPLTSYIYLSPNADFPRGDTIRKVTIHHMAGDFTLENVGTVFARQDRRASANYGIDSAGRVALYVEEGNRAWSSSSQANDDQAVTIEVANDEIGGEWHVSDAAYAALLDLCEDICRRNGIRALRYTGDAGGTLTLHCMFSDGTECPGPYLKGRMGEIAETVNSRLEGG